MGGRKPHWKMRFSGSSNIYIPFRATLPESDSHEGCRGVGLPRAPAGRRRGISLPPMRMKQAGRRTTIGRCLLACALTATVGRAHLCAKPLLELGVAPDTASARRRGCRRTPVPTAELKLRCLSQRGCVRAATQAIVHDYVRRLSLVEAQVQTCRPPGTAAARRRGVSRTQEPTADHELRCLHQQAAARGINPHSVRMLSLVAAWRRVWMR